MSLWDRFRAPKMRSTNGCRIYAIGDVHGRFDLLVNLLKQIERDQDCRPQMETHVVMLGDYIDRGPQSRQVCELLQAVATSPYFHALRGNHEQVMLDVLEGSHMALRQWIRFGGIETLLNWGIDTELVNMVQENPDAEKSIIESLRDLTAPSFVDWLRALPSFRLIGDYLFVHAGVRPAVALEEQSDDDLLWIREPFLSSKRRHPWRVVHGHSQSDRVDAFRDRIGIDTGAYRTGILTAIGIEDDRYWTIQTEEEQGQTG